MGTRFIASLEAHAQPEYKRMLVEAGAADIVYTPYFSGIPGNYLKASVRNVGLDPDRLPDAQREGANFDGGEKKAWRDVWSAGHGVGNIHEVLPTADIVAALRSEYQQACVDTRDVFNEACV
jgi:nitronate monooxygenase